jgi:biotin transport system substrate-specific component
MIAQTHTDSGTILSHSTSDTARTFVRAASVALAVLVTAGAAQVSWHLPFTSVPFVLTPLAVMLTGAALGSRLGFLAQALYLAAGAAGLAVFAPSAILPPGAGRLIGPTGGYLMAYPVAAFVTGWLAERGWDRRYLSSLASMLAGLAVIFVGGVAWLSVLPGQTIATAVAQGFVPYAGIDLIKAAIAAQVLPLAWKVIGRRQGAETDR